MQYKFIETQDTAKFSKALAEFEENFKYALNANSQFKISHAPDYTSFYRSMGESFCLIAFDNEQIVGSLSCVIREMYSHNHRLLKKLAYIGDLKVLPRKQGALVCHQLLQTMQNRVAGLVDTVIAVAMEGTPKTPDQYTGRIGIPKLNAVTQNVILRIETRSGQADPQVEHQQSGFDPSAFHHLIQYNYLLLHNPLLRSSITPISLKTKCHSACGLLEDTRNSKRLFDEANNEILSSHLSFFAFNDIDAAMKLLSTALAISAKKGFPGMFLTLSMENFLRIQSALTQFQFSCSEVVIYANQPDEINNLVINSSEI